jgi:transcriptional regulator of NAD metabolism
MMQMDGQTRRERMIQMLQEATDPIPGARLAKELGVSRQVIVQDVALLRAVNRNILSTNKGYVLFLGRQGGATRSFHVRHTNEKIADELNTIVDCGGNVQDVTIEHPIYGQISVDLIIKSRMDVAHFVEQVKTYQTKPLNELTGGEHFHTVTAASEDTLDRIEEALKGKGYLIDEYVKNDTCAQ